MLKLILENDKKIEVLRPNPPTVEAPPRPILLTTLGSEDVF